MQQLPSFADPLWFIAATAAIFAVIMLRYFFVAGLFYLVFFRWRAKQWKGRTIIDRNYKPRQMKTEVKWSTITTLIFSVFGAISLVLWQQGYLKVYTNVHKYPLWWLPASLIIALLLHETYYYWAHRWMHYPKVFRVVHKVHHDSHITSPWTAFSFHPLEALLQAVFLPLLLLVLPMHLYVLLFQLSFMTLTSVINHLNIEVYPRQFHKNAVGQWMIGATHHSLHHKSYKHNYGLYFTFWDKWLKTESPFFVRWFEEKTRGAPTNANPPAGNY